RCAGRADRRLQWRLWLLPGACGLRKLRGGRRPGVWAAGRRSAADLYITLRSVMLGVILFLGVLAGLDNFQVCSSLGLLPVRRAQKHLLALAFGTCETLAPLAGLAAVN